jgi:hypothetical protein
MKLRLKNRNRPFWIALAIGAVVLAGCAGDGRRDGARGDLSQKSQSGAHRGSDDQLFTAALQAIEDDDCASAITPLRRLAHRGKGYEVAQAHLGSCLGSASAAEDNEEIRALLDREREFWLLTSAHSNEAKAQALLAAAYWDGVGVGQDRLQAAVWLLRFEANAMRNQMGAPTFSTAKAAEIRSGLSNDEWAKAERLALDWTPIEQSYYATAPRRAARSTQSSGGWQGQKRRGDRGGRPISLSP